MRRLTILAVRAVLVLLLAAAIADVPLPARSTARARLHLVDRSDSVRKGPGDAPRPEDADRVRAYDQQHKEPQDAVLWASFGREIAFESTAVDGTETNLAGALEAALARNPTEIVLYTDGRADPGRSLLLCRARGVPVHVFPLGAARVRDARIARVHAPPGERVPIDVTVVSTFDARIPVRMGGEAREANLVAGVPLVVTFPDRPPGPFTVKLEVEDDCSENNEARGSVLPPAGAKRVLTISSGFSQLQMYDVAVLDGVGLTPEQQRSLADWVRDFGGGLILLGGPRSYALGRWKGTPIEEVSPLRANPDQKVAVIFVIDCSGSMIEKLDVVVAAVKAGWDFFESGDYVAALPLPQGGLIENRKELNQLQGGGGSPFAEPLRKARQRLVQINAPRKQIFLLTDGHTSSQETVAQREQEGRELRSAQIALTVVTVDRAIEIGDHVPIADWKGLAARFEELLPKTREIGKADPGTLVLHEHPATAGVADAPLPWMNLTSAKPTAQIVGTVGKAPAIFPALAFGQWGRGRVGAFAYERPDPKLLAQAIEYVGGASSRGLLLSIDPPVVRARGIAPAEARGLYHQPASGEKGGIEFRQVLSDAWEAPLPAVKPGTLSVRWGGAQASVTIPCHREHEALGVDSKALERIAAETGGRVLRSPGELAALPRPSGAASRPGRPLFLVAALAVLFLEMALSTFWKA